MVSIHKETTTVKNKEDSTKPQCLFLPEVQHTLQLLNVTNRGEM